MDKFIEEALKWTFTQGPFAVLSAIFGIALVVLFLRYDKLWDRLLKQRDESEKKLIDALDNQASKFERAAIEYRAARGK